LVALAKAMPSSSEPNTKVEMAGPKIYSRATFIEC
jgi:hypothetical protein